MCKIYLSPKAAKKRKAEEEENERLKKEEVVFIQEVEQLDLHQPGQSQSHDMVCCELKAQDQKSLPQQLPFPYNLDDFSEFISFEQQPVIKDFEDFWTDFIKSYTLLDGDEESNNTSLFLNASSQYE